MTLDENNKKKKLKKVVEKLNCTKKYNIFLSHSQFKKKKVVAFWFLSCGPEKDSVLVITAAAAFSDL